MWNFPRSSSMQIVRHINDCYIFLKNYFTLLTIHLFTFKVTGLTAVKFFYVINIFITPQTTTVESNTRLKEEIDASPTSISKCSAQEIHYFELPTFYNPCFWILKVLFKWYKQNNFSSETLWILYILIHKILVVNYFVYQFKG